MAHSNLLEESFLSHAEKVREEIIDKFLKSHQILHEREFGLLAELDDLVASYRSGQELREQIQELNRMAETLTFDIQRNYRETVVNSVAVLENRIRELEVSLETTETRMRRVELEWDGELEGRLREIGRIRIIGQLDYKTKGEPVKTAFEHRPIRSTEAGVFFCPSSLTIDSLSKNIYICDSGNDRVQVFNDSLAFLFQFSEKMHGPSGICIYENQVFVAQMDYYCLNVYSIDGALLQSVGNKGSQELEFDSPEGVVVSNVNDLVYICDTMNNRIQCLNLNLTFRSFIRNVFNPRDIKLTPNEIVVLKGDSFCICLFNYSHQFVRTMIRCGEGFTLRKPSFFCLDDDNNLLITDFSTHCIAVYSFRGELIHHFGNELTRQLNIFSPSGIALNSENLIIVVFFGIRNCLFLF